MKFTKSQNAELRRVVDNFNKKVKLLEQQGIKAPEHVKVRELKETIGNQRELNRRMNQLKKFSVKSGKTMVRVGKDRVKMSKWQRDILYANRRVAKRRLEKEVGQYQRAIASKSAKKAPVQAMKKEVLANKLSQLEYVSRDISSMSKSQLETAISTAEHEVNKYRSDKNFYDNFFDMMFKDAQVTGLKDKRLSTIKNKLRQLSPEQLYIAYNAEPMLKHFVEYYSVKDFNALQSEADEAEINKMNTNIENLLSKVDSIVSEFSEY